MKKMQNIFWISVPFVLIGYLVYKIAFNSFTDKFLGAYPTHVKAVIISEKNFMEINQLLLSFPIPIHLKLMERYIQVIRMIRPLRIGDTVLVEYNKDHPQINKPINPKN